MRDYAPIAEKLRTNRFNCPTQYVDAAADAIEALQVEVKRLQAEVAQTIDEMRMHGLHEYARARDDALEEAAKMAAIFGDYYAAERIRALKGKP